MQHALLFEIGEHRLEIVAAKTLAPRERQLEGRATHVVEQDEKLVGLDARVLDRRPEEELGVAHHVLIEGGAARHEHAERRALPPPRPAEPLPGRGDRAGVAVADAHVERADVHAELEGGGRDDAVDSARAQRALDRTALTR